MYRGRISSRQLGKWIQSYILNHLNEECKGKKVKVIRELARLSDGTVVKRTTDGWLTISTVFKHTALLDAFQRYEGEEPNWTDALLILKQFTIQYQCTPKEPHGEFLLVVDKFSVWDLQPGFGLKYDVTNCMWVPEIRSLAAKERKNIMEESQTRRGELDYLLDLMSQNTQSQVENDEDSLDKNKISDSLMEQLVQPFTAEEFYIPESQWKVLESLKEWQIGFTPSLPSEADVLEQESVEASDGLNKNSGISAPKSRKVDSSNERCGKGNTNKVTKLSGTGAQHTSRAYEPQPGTSHQSPPDKVLHHSSNEQETSLQQLSQEERSAWEDHVDSVRFSDESTAEEQLDFQENESQDVAVSIPSEQGDNITNATYCGNLYIDPDDIKTEPVSPTIDKEQVISDNSTNLQCDVDLANVKTEPVSPTIDQEQVITDNSTYLPCDVVLANVKTEPVSPSAEQDYASTISSTHLGSEMNVTEIKVEMVYSGEDYAITVNSSFSDCEIYPTGIDTEQVTSFLDQEYSAIESSGHVRSGMLRNSNLRASKEFPPFDLGRHVVTDKSKERCGDKDKNKKHNSQEFVIRGSSESSSGEVHSIHDTSRDSSSENVVFDSPLANSTQIASTSWCSKQLNLLRKTHDSRKKRIGSVSTGNATLDKGIGNNNRLEQDIHNNNAERNEILNNFRLGQGILDDKTGKYRCKINRPGHDKRYRNNNRLVQDIHNNNTSGKDIRNNNTVGKESGRSGISSTKRFREQNELSSISDKDSAGRNNVISDTNCEPKETREETVNIDKVVLDSSYCSLGCVLGLCIMKGCRLKNKDNKESELNESLDKCNQTDESLLEFESIEPTRYSRSQNPCIETKCVSQKNNNVRTKTNTATSVCVRDPKLSYIGSIVTSQGENILKGIESVIAAEKKLNLNQNLTENLPQAESCARPFGESKDTSAEENRQPMTNSVDLNDAGTQPFEVNTFGTQAFSPDFNNTLRLSSTSSSDFSLLKDSPAIGTMRNRSSTDSIGPTQGFSPKFTETVLNFSDLVSDDSVLTGNRLGDSGKPESPNQSHVNKETNSGTTKEGTSQENSESLDQSNLTIESKNSENEKGNNQSVDIDSLQMEEESQSLLIDLSSQHYKKQSVVQASEQTQPVYTESDTIKSRRYNKAPVKINSRNCKINLNILSLKPGLSVKRSRAQCVEQPDREGTHKKRKVSVETLSEERDKHACIDETSSDSETLTYSISPEQASLTRLKTREQDTSRAKQVEDSDLSDISFMSYLKRSKVNEPYRVIPDGKNVSKKVLCKNNVDSQYQQYVSEPKQNRTKDQGKGLYRGKSYRKCDSTNQSRSNASQDNWITKKAVDIRKEKEQIYEFQDSPTPSASSSSSSDCVITKVSLATQSGNSSSSQETDIQRSQSKLSSLIIEAETSVGRRLQTFKLILPEHLEAQMKDVWKKTA